MAVVGKRFDPQLFKECDHVAKLMGWLHLTKQPHINTIIHNQDRYGCDLIFHEESEPTKQHLLECEIKKVWSGGKFPYDSVQILGRKKKYFDQGASILLAAANYQDYLIISAEDVLDSPLVNVRNKYNYNGEYMYQVPISKATFFRFSDPVTPTTPVDCSSCGYHVAVRVDAGNWMCGGCNEWS